MLVKQDQEIDMPPTVTKQEIAERIKGLRRAIGGTQAEFADALGISTSTYKQYEGARNYPSIPVLQCFYLVGADLHWLLTGEGQPLRVPSVPYYADKIDAERLVRFLLEVDRLIDELGMPPSNLAKAELVATLYNHSAPSDTAPSVNKV